MHHRRLDHTRPDTQGALHPVGDKPLYGKVDQPSVADQLAAAESGNDPSYSIYFGGVVDVQRRDELRDPITGETWRVFAATRPSRPVYTKVIATLLVEPATIALRQPGITQEWSEAAERMVATPLAPYWTGPAVIKARTDQARQVSAAEDEETVASYLVTVAASVAADEFDLLEVTTSADPALAGRVLEVRQVIRGDLLADRQLICTLTD